MPMAASYDLNDLIKDCENDEKIFITKQAQSSAGNDFGLHTKKKVLDFIAAGGLETPRYINTEPWDNNRSTNIILVDAYSFYSGTKHGYFAFLFNTTTDKWIIKSFKLNKDSIPRNTPWFNGLSAIKKLVNEDDDKAK
jgi:hypothetical protein